MKNYRGKIIYNPSGKAGEYSYWAANFYNGCSGDCSYCYMKKPPLNQVWSDEPILKKSLINQEKALEIFEKELKKNLINLRINGLFFNFNSDPFLKPSIYLNRVAIKQCVNYDIPVKILTKQTWWLKYLKEVLPSLEFINIGFTLTGYDELEKGCATNKERIEAMKELKSHGFKTWASIEPIIDFESSFEMIEKSLKYCDHYKIGLMSGKKYHKDDILIFMDKVNDLNYPTYWKDELLKQADIERKDLPKNCVDRNYI